MGEPTGTSPETVENHDLGYEELEAEYKASQQQLHSKEQALRILQSQLKKADLASQRMKQEMNQLRSQLSRSQQFVTPPTSPANPSCAATSSNGVSFSINEELIREKEQLIQELEKAHWQIGELERQGEELKDEKENMEDEKMHYMTKYEGLLECFEEEKKRQPPSQSTVQRVMDEHKQLQLALVEANASKEHFKSRVERYKDAIERKKFMAEAAIQASSSEKKQDVRAARIAELESLAKNLTETVKVKSVTISHQKKANKMLATDLAKLQHRLNLWEASCSCGKNWETAHRNSLHSSSVSPPAEEAEFEWKSSTERMTVGRKLSGNGNNALAVDSDTDSSSATNGELKI